MCSNPNTEYEKLAKEIYTTLHECEGINTIDVRHNVKIKGKSGCNHQIDVYWEFEMVGEVHRIAIECKNYSKEVSVGKIRDFYGVLSDIGDIKGIFITKVGYQSGAIRFGEYHGISLKELRVPNDKDWQGRVKDIIFDISAYSKIVKNTDIKVDSQWVKKNTSYKENDKISLGGLNNEIIIIDKQGNQISSMYDLEAGLPQEFKEEKDLEKEYTFDEAYLCYKNNQKFKLISIKFTYDVILNTERIVSEGEGVAKAILKDLKTGDIKFFDKNGNVK